MWPVRGRSSDAAPSFQPSPFTVLRSGLNMTRVSGIVPHRGAVNVGLGRFLTDCLLCCFLCLANCPALVDPCSEQRISHREYHRADKEPDDAKSEQPSDHTDNDQQQREIRSFLYQNGS